MNFYENLVNFDTTGFGEQSLLQTDKHDGDLREEWFEGMNLEVPKKGSPKLAILLANNYGKHGGCCNCPGISMQIATLFAQNGYGIKLISNATQLDDCVALVLPHAVFELPSLFFSAPSRKVEFSEEVQVFAQCIKAAANKKIPLLAVGKSMLLLAGMGGLKLCERRYIETPINHANANHGIEVIEGSPFNNLNGLSVESRHSVFVAPPKVQRELLKLSEDTPLPFFAFARDGMPEGIADLEHGILGVQWLPDFFGQEPQICLLAWLDSQVKKV